MATAALEKITTAQNTMMVGALSFQEASVAAEAIADAVSKGEIIIPNLPKGTPPKDIPASVLLQAAKNLPAQQLNKAMGNNYYSLKS